MKGRKPAPPELKIARGERPDRINEDAPRAVQGLPAAPPWLDAVAMAEWDRIVPELAALGVLSRSDGPALAVYCTVFSRWRKALDKIDEEGLSESTDKGGAKGSPYVAVAQNCEAQLARLLAEFGGTPSARHRCSAIKPEAPKDELSAFLARRKAK